MAGPFADPSVLCLEDGYSAMMSQDEWAKMTVGSHLHHHTVLLCVIATRFV